MLTEPPTNTKLVAYNNNGEVNNIEEETGGRAEYVPRISVCQGENLLAVCHANKQPDLTGC
jgi:hypothetical protein